MKILITGNMGYVGPGVVSQLRATFPNAELIGYDMAYFAACLTNADFLPESKLNAQLFGNITSISHKELKGVDVVIHLAAISNDPMGKKYEDLTIEVNYKASERLARMAKDAGARAFVFASSCSVYGATEGVSKTEDSAVGPLTAYAKSKVLTEEALADLADEDFTVTALRFATACGMSERLRLDLVLNDFVAAAVVSGKIEILSDGTPWRPLIHVKDMARAIEWAINREPRNSDYFLAINAGSNDWNFQVHELARAVATAIPGTSFSCNELAPIDNRSYRVSFDLYQSLAPQHQPLYSLRETIVELHEGLVSMNFKNSNFRNSSFMRLQVLTQLQENNHINANLEWNHSNSPLKSITHDFHRN
ncbi:NAD-dependent epimerase/dehydratase family protein [Pedobacter sp.]|uniref:NAD-dependent epimerase/dehydratase family protein n=1 Tax=Pedobacter sp. TaxID=1411316 RepID=UPI003D7F3296